MTSDTKDKVLTYVKTYGSEVPIKVRTIADALRPITQATISYHLIDLTNRGYVIQVGRGLYMFNSDDELKNKPIPSFKRGTVKRKILDIMKNMKGEPLNVDQIMDLGYPELDTSRTVVYNMMHVLFQSGAIQRVDKGVYVYNEPKKMIPQKKEEKIEDKMVSLSEVQEHRKFTALSDLKNEIGMELRIQEGNNAEPGSFRLCFILGRKLADEIGFKVGDEVDLMHYKGVYKVYKKKFTTKMTRDEKDRLIVGFHIPLGRQFTCPTHPEVFNRNQYEIGTNLITVDTATRQIEYR